MDFEDVLDEVGSFGIYQKVLIIAMIPPFVVIPWFCTNMIFMSDTPEHWCYVPEMAGSSLPLSEQKQLIRAPHDPSCRMHDINYTQVLHAGNLTIDSSWPTKQCDKAWQYDRSDYDATAVTRWNMVCSDNYYSSLVISLTFIGSLFGTPLFGLLSDKLGRKVVFFGLATLISLTEVGSSLCPNFTLFLVLRAVNGSASPSIYVSSYIILLEMANPAFRTRINGIAIMSWSIGLCLLPLIAWLTRNWVHLSMVTSSVAAGLLLYYNILPESPRWLIIKERYEEAHSILSRVSKMNGRSVYEDDLMQKILILGEKIKKQKASSETRSVLDLLRYPTLRKRFLLVTTCWMCNSVPYYGLLVNVKNLAGNEFLNFFLMSVVEIPAHSVAWFCMERIGRRWCSVFSFFFLAISCLVPVISPKEYTMVGIVASLVARANSSIVFMTIYQQCPELIPTSLRGAGMGISSTLGYGAALLVPYIIHLAKFGAYIPFLSFAVISFLAGVSASFLPETLNENLPQTVTDAENFKKNFKFFSFAIDKDSASKDRKSSDGVVKTSEVVLEHSDKEDVLEEPCKLIKVLILNNSASPSPESNTRKLL